MTLRDLLDHLSPWILDRHHYALVDVVCWWYTEGQASYINCERRRMHGPWVEDGAPWVHESVFGYSGVVHLHILLKQTPFDAASTSIWLVGFFFARLHEYCRTLTEIGFSSIHWRSPHSQAIAELVWRNGRAWNSGSRGHGFETRLCHLVFT